ncbi:hypothetical protein BJV44_000134 [Clostridium beijerinckii]|uniref:hypothetical protein n=1 Tax=Clostridium beijerinckii TaxID=1520 RepID=UPI0017CD56B3|nr:hypothetical protein [Clostridium beijerinckii]
MRRNNSYGVRKNVLKELADGFSCIHENFRYFSKLSKNGYKVLGASEWLLDNIYLIEKEYKAIKIEMPIDYFKGLSSIGNVNYNRNKDNNTDEDNENRELIPRIFVVAKDYINNGNEIDCDKLISYINGLQGDIENGNFNNKEKIFTTGELWAFPLMLKIAIIINLSKYTNELVDIQKEIIRGRDIAEKIIDAINNNKFEEKIGNINVGKNIGPLFLREFFSVLRDNSIEDPRINDLVESKWKVNSDLDKNNIRSDLREEVLERNIGEYITFIRKIEGISWRRFFEETSFVEKILKNDPANIYDSMDFESKDYYRHKLEKMARISNADEITLASNILELARNSKTNKEENYKCHIGYYLIDEGINELKKYGNNIKTTISANTYVACNIFGTLLISFLILLISGLLGVRYTVVQYVISFLIILIPVNEIIIGLTNYTVGKVVDIRLIPKLNFSSGIPKGNKTVVVIPAIVNSKEKVKELMKKLEVAYCGNKDKNIYFALLSDFHDSEHETAQEDVEIIKSGVQYARDLNEKYSDDFKNDQGVSENRFFFFSRKRIYNKNKMYSWAEKENVES